MYGENTGQEEVEHQEEETGDDESETWETQFEKFYKKYPRKVKKQEVKKWFEKNKPSSELFSSIIDSLEQFRGCKDWLKENGQYIPYPNTWLNQKRWEDESIIKGAEQKNKSSFEQREYDNLDSLYANKGVMNNA